ncbi:hypothetical protein [Sphaerisporangium dianthi]|uniref:ATP-binding protein n=1 Tax=Sphaerisporangium dianthi TaxID=1436120 RepID=A0ABV9CK47_9ACTN
MRRRTSLDDEGGRGLGIVERLTTARGVDPGACGTGKVVWWKRCR